jgi:hypothetical protein
MRKSVEDGKRIIELKPEGGTGFKNSFKNMSILFLSPTTNWLVEVYVKWIQNTEI